MTAFKSIVVAIALAAGAQGATAQFVVHGSQFGANTIIRDRSSGLSWLQLTASTGLTAADWSEAYAYADASWDRSVESGYVGVGITFQSGVYAGYRVATQSEATQLVQNYLGCTYACGGFRWSDGSWPTDPLIASRLLDLIGIFGADISIASDGGQSGFMSGMVASDAGYQFPAYSFSVSASVGPAGSFTASDRWNSVPGFTYPWGHTGPTFLISPIPEPSTYVLMLAGLAAVAFAAKRRRFPSDQVAA